MCAPQACWRTQRGRGCPSLRFPRPHSRATSPRPFRGVSFVVVLDRLTVLLNSVSTFRILTRDIVLACVRVGHATVHPLRVWCKRCCRWRNVPGRPCRSSRPCATTRLQPQKTRSSPPLPLPVPVITNLLLCFRTVVLRAFPILYHVPCCCPPRLLTKGAGGLPAP